MFLVLLIRSLLQVGLPAKSGVSGGILLVVPNVMGIMCWSPPLDKLGNSVRGIQFCTVGNGGKKGPDARTRRRGRVFWSSRRDRRVFSALVLSGFGGTLQFSQLRQPEALRQEIRPPQRRRGAAGKRSHDSLTRQMPRLAKNAAQTVSTHTRTHTYAAEPY